jgi:hypothetical protein
MASLFSGWFEHAYSVIIMKTLFSLLLFITGPVFAIAQIPEAGLIGKYSFSGNALNEAGNYAHGTVFGASLAPDRCGKADSAYHFSQTDDHISIPVFNLLMGNELCISLWAKADFFTSNCMAMLAADDWSDRCVMCAQYVGNPTYIIWDYGDCSVNGRTIVTMIDTSSFWHHYVFQTSEADNLKQIFVDGQCVSSTGFQGSLINRDRELYIGAGFDWSGGGIGFKGSIDDIRIYNRALSTREVISLLYENICELAYSGVDKPMQSLVTMCPNPSRDMVTLTGVDSGVMELSDITGKRIRTLGINSSQFVFSVSDLPSGVYLVSLWSGNTRVVRKLIRE